MRSSELLTLLAALVRPLREWRFYALLAASVLLWVACYQYKTQYELNVGGLQDDAFVVEFHGKEGNAERDYRWSRGYSTIRFPGIGNQPVELTLTLVGFRLEGSPPQVEVQARGQNFSIQTTAAPQAYTLFVPRGDPWQGDLDVSLGVPTFSPPGDPRELGVLVDRLEVRPADSGLRPVVIPPVGTVGGLLAGLAGVYLVLRVAFRRARWALLGVALLGALFGLLIVVSRLELGLLAPQLPTLSLWALLVAVASRLLLGRLLSSQGRGAEVAVGLGTLATVAAFVLRFGGLTYPQFLTSDILLHAHNVQQVMRGEWLFTERLPDYTPVPYPPALYVVLSPVAAIFGADDASISLHLKLATSLLDATCCVALTWAGARLWGGRAGGLAALFYALSPAPFELYSAGNYTNLFAQGTLNVTLLGALVFFGRMKYEVRSMKKATPHTSYFILHTSYFAFGFALTMLGHYGMMLSALLIGVLFGVWVVFRRSYASNGWVVLVGFGGALVVSFALYYRHFINEIWSQVNGIVSRFGRAAQEAPPGVQVEGAREGFLERSARRIAQLLGFQTVLPALFGALLASRPSPVRALLAAWLLAGAIFFLLDQALGDAVRWYYLAAAPLALLAGRYLGQLAGRSRAGTVLATLAVVAALWHVLQIWVGELIFTRYH